MHIVRNSFLASLLLALAAGAAAQGDATPRKAPLGGSMVVAPQAFLGAKLKTIGAEYATFEHVTVDGPGFHEGLRITVKQCPLKYYHVQAKLQQLPAIHQGDVLLAAFYARCLSGGSYETATGQVQFSILDRGSEKHLVSYLAQPNGQWQQFFVPCQSSAEMTDKAAILAFSAGVMLQTIEIGGVSLTNYGKTVSIKDLPQTVVTYDGREADAPWRAAAEKRIEQYRKADLTVVVKDAAGQPLPKATVSVRMQRHAFHFGAAVPSRCFQDSLAARSILENHARLFNQGVSIQWFHWKEQETAEGRQNADRICDYFATNQMAVRGHVLMYERSDELPADVLAMIANHDKAGLRQRVKDYITKVVSAYKGRINDWEVENEAVDNNLVRQVLGPGSIADFYKWARAADPGARLSINDNRIEGLKPDKSDRLLGLVKEIADHGGPLDSIGIQSHMQSAPVPPDVLLAYFDKLAATGKKLAITEYDFDTTDESLRADYSRDFFTTVFSHPSFNGITIWRFWDSKPEKHQSVIYATNWTMRPSGKVCEDLVRRKWWTSVDGTSDASGCFCTRGFQGDYQATAKADGKTASVNFAVKGSSPNVVEIGLK